MINTVIFDVGGVLVHFDRDIYFSKRGYELAKAKQLTQAVFDHPAWLEYDLGNLDDVTIRNRFMQDAPELADDIEKSLIHLHGVISKKTSTIPWIRSIQQMGQKVYILSNIGKTCVADNRDALDFVSMVDGCFWSYEHHVIKPDPKAFQMMMDQFHIDPKQAVFIDDTKKNVEAGKQFGLYGLWYQDQRQAESDLMAILKGN